jgi:hypothetical protein
MQGQALWAKYCASETHTPIKKRFPRGVSHGKRPYRSSSGFPSGCYPASLKLTFYDVNLSLQLLPCIETFLTAYNDQYAMMKSAPVRTYTMMSTNKTPPPKNQILILHQLQQKVTGEKEEQKIKEQDQSLPR